VPAVKPVLITPAEALAEVVVVVALVYVVTAIAVVRILVAIRVPIVGLPPILPVCLSRTKALLIAVVDGLPEHVRAILIGLIVRAASRVSIIRRRVEVRILIGSVDARVLNAELLLARPVLLLIAILRRTSLLL
jgi:hypothetical protein